MPDPTAAKPTGHQASPRSLRAVDRAVGELRRGDWVVIHEASGVAALALAAEHASAEALAALEGWGGREPLLVLTAHRAGVLNIRPTGEEVVLLPLEPGLAAGAIRDLVDPTADLDNPLRGPFRLAERPAAATDHAAVALCKLAQLLPAAVTAAVPAVAGEPRGWAQGHDLLDVAAQEIAAYQTRAAVSLTRVAEARVPLAGAENARVIAFRPGTGGVEHLAIVVGDPGRREPVLTRLHSECFTGDLLASLRCDCGQQLRGSIELMAQHGSGLLLYLAQEGRGIGLTNKLRAYQLQDQGFDTIDANQRLGFEADERIFLPAAEMLRLLGFARVRLLTNNPHKVAGLERHGIEVVERVPHAFAPSSHNERYLATKAGRAGHLL
ncbi:MAG: GTP cyclohydrolase II [Alphaproteobacteria bacterium]